MKQENKRWKHYILAFLAVLIGVLFDQWTKLAVVKHLKGNDPFIIWKGVFKLQYLENQGAAFGIFQNKQFLFIICAVLIVCAAIWFYSKVPMTKRFLPLRLCALFICAGGIGNLIDRLTHRFVVDFFYFEWIDFPIFNVADIYVTVSAFALIFLILFYYKEEELEEVFPYRDRK